jgi:hypothetical protein
VKPITQEGWAGAFSHLFEADGAVLVSSFWRKGGKDEVGGNVRVLSP